MIADGLIRENATGEMKQLTGLAQQSHVFISSQILKTTEACDNKANL
jgi:hypothetical protein